MLDLVMYFDSSRPSDDFDSIFFMVSEGQCPFTVDYDFNCSHCLFVPICYHPNTLLYG